MSRHFINRQSNVIVYAYLHQYKHPISVRSARGEFALIFIVSRPTLKALEKGLLRKLWIFSSDYLYLVPSQSKDDVVVIDLYQINLIKGSWGQF